ncbi:unnamed protein product [Aureobasidium mustum]|uniref:Uncharacterized protein n=1 Tax=Aureobasidium mustum TaxID=2773714 RepID=A0A9N8JZJ4_9PEZI|nr:unnamed protein product [Aureobasidium mustum]
MNGHHWRFTSTFATQDPKDRREAKYNAENTAELNSGAALAIVDKQPSMTVIDKLRDWEKDAVYEICEPHPSGRSFSVSGIMWSSPDRHIVGKPSMEEQLAAINFGKLIGSLEGGKIVKIPQAEDSTGAIPVMDTEVRGEMFYYIPAQLERLAMSSIHFETTPSFIILKKGEMPSFVFWKRLAGVLPSYSESDLMEHSRAIRSGAPTPEARPAPVAAPASETLPAPLAVNTTKAAEEVEKPAQPMWEIFDPRLEEDPIEFLDFYNTCLNGRKGIRNKLMLREADIDRVNYISPCLAHNHKEIVEESGADSAEAEETVMEVDPVPTVPQSKPAGSSTPKSISPVAPKRWVQPGPIPDDDPSWLRFLARQDKERQIRGARIRPKPVFTPEFCNVPGTTSDPKKAVLRRELYDKYYHRAVTANRELESRSKCCLACGLQWTKCTTTRHAHYKQHRDELKLYRQHCQNENILVEDPLRVESLDPAKAPMINNVPALNWFRDLEQIILNMENELLEREQTCRICDAHVDFADESMSDHYQKHAAERKQLRAIGDIVNSMPTTPTVIVTPTGASIIDGSAKSSPAGTYTRPSTTPEYLKRIYRQMNEAQAKKAVKDTNMMADVMEEVVEQIRETGNIQSGPHLSPPISLSSGSKSSEPVVTASNDVMDTTEDGPIHSDVIGNTTAQRLFPPFMTPASQSPKAAKDNLDFLSGYSGNKEESLDFLSKYDAHTVPPFDKVELPAHCSPRQNRNVESEVIVIEDDDTDLYASPAPGPVDTAEELPADNDQAEIVQAIRSNSGELLALNDTAINNSEDDEEVLDAEVIESEEAKEVPEEFETEDAEVPEESEVDGDETETEAEEVPPEFGRREVYEPDASDASSSSKAWCPPHDGLFDNLEPSPELSQNSSLHNAEDEYDAAKLLAHAIGQKVLRKMKMKLDLEKAFAAIDATEELIFNVENTSRNGLVTLEQEIYGYLIDRLFNLHKTVERRRPHTASVNPQRFSFKNVYLTPDDLLNGVHLKWYDIWRIVIKAKEAFLEWVAQNSEDSVPAIKEQIVELLRGVLMNASRHGYQDEPFPIDGKVPVRHDRLDLRYGDLRINHLLTAAHRWGCGFNNLMVLSDQAWKMAIDMVKAERALPSAQGPDTARLRILNQVQRYVRTEIKKEKRWRRMTGQRLGPQAPEGEQSANQASPNVSSAKWSTEAVASTTPRTPFNSPLDSGSANIDQQGKQRHDDSFQPGPPTPFNPDEESPRMPKVPRKNLDPSYRPGSALLDPTTPPVTPGHPKRKPNRETDGRFAKKVEKKFKGKQQKKTEKKKGKKVTFDTALSSKSSSSLKSSTAASPPSKLPSPQVVITKKPAIKKSSTPTPTKKTSKAAAPKSSKSGVKKTVAKSKKAQPVAAATRPKRRAAIEAEKSFGKTKIIG